MPSKDRLPEFKADPAQALEQFIHSLDDHPDFSHAERISETFVVRDYPNQIRQVTAGNVALVGDTALSIDPAFGVGCGWAFQMAEWLVDATAQTLVNKGALHGVLKTYAKHHQQRLGEHVFVVTDFSKRQDFNLIERLMFSAATKDVDMARHVALFGHRISSLAQFLAPRAILRALWVNLTQMAPTPRRTHTA